MRLFLGLVSAAVLMSTPALAQTETPAAAPAAVTSRCGEPVAAPPTLQDGATASRGAIEQMQTQLTAWADATRVKLECRRTEAQEARATADALTNAYNAQAAQLNTTIAAWQAEVDEYNARGNRRRGN